MPFVAAKCTECGGNLQIDSTKDAAICPYCGTPFVVEKAINLYNTTNNISANTVNIYNSNADFDIRAGELIKYNGAATEVVIPDNVTIIGNYAFKDCKGLKSVVIPNSVTSIKEQAFKNCMNLKEIDIPNSVTSIGIEVFDGCTSLCNVHLSENITSLYDSSFRNCISLISISIPDGVNELINGVFAMCKNLKQVTLPKSLSNLGYSTFANCVNLSEIIIPNSVNELSPMVFYKTNLKRVLIPESVKLIKSNAFGYCENLTSVTLPSEVRFDCYNSCNDRYEGAFHHCKKLINVSYLNGEQFREPWIFDEPEHNNPFKITPFYLNVFKTLIKKRQCVHCGAKIGILSSSCKKCSTRFYKYTIGQMEKEISSIQIQLRE